MSRGGSYGGGKSSLGFLFGSESVKNTAPPPPSPTPNCIPPYGIETTTDNPPQKSPPPPPPKDQNVSNTYQRSAGRNSANLFTGRPSTKVKSVPGGDSSLGYIFGDN